MKTSRSLPKEILNNAPQIWIHLAIIVGLSSIFYAFLRLAGYTEDLGYSISLIFVVLNIIVPNIYILVVQQTPKNIIIAAKYVLIPSVVGGGGIVISGPSARSAIAEWLSQINPPSSLAFDVIIKWSILVLILAIFYIMFATVNFVRVRRHPLSGYIRVFRVFGDPDFSGKTLFHEILPQRNRVVIRPVGASSIKRIIVISPNKDYAQRELAQAIIQFKDGSKKEILLDPKQKAIALGDGLFIEKGPYHSAG